MRRGSGRLATWMGTRPLWVRRASIGLVTLVLLAGMLVGDYLEPGVMVQVGQPSPRDVESPRTIEFVDQARTEAMRAEAMRATPPVLRPSPSQVAAAVAAAAVAFDAIEAARTASGPAGRAEAIQQAVGVPLSPAAAAAAAGASATGLAAARRTAMTAVEQTLADGVREDALLPARERARAIVRAAGLAPGLTLLASEVAVGVLRPTMEVDAVRTLEVRQAAANLVAPVRVRVQRGQSILRKGDVVTRSHLEILRIAGLYPPHVTLEAVAGIIVIVALLLVITGAYLWQFQREVWARDRLVILWSLLVVSTVGLAQVLGAPRFSNFLAPAAAGSMLLAILLRPPLALFSTPVLAILTGLAAGGDLGPVVVAFVGGLVAVYATRQIHRRSDFGKAGIVVGLVNAAAVIGAGLLQGPAEYQALVVNATYALGNGLLSAVITIGVLPFLEQMFGLITPIKLLELANPAHPLLRRLQLEAPGTYHHSIMVGNLAEAAAEAIGADALLVRVGTYYHDVGKLRRPAFFVENQVGIENPHEKMSPSLSALTVGAHVRDGLELAREYGLPQAVADFIPQHHGTALLTYFFHQALERGDPLDEAAFRYDGPKPQTRETAIVMLADAVEATVRTLNRPTPDRLHEVVRRLIREKLEDGQLDECGLTFRELDRIAAAFVRILSGMLHPRVEYPDLEGELIRRRREQVARVR
ncbi:MAG: HDIG domain-containing protein [Armatimonadota bacterium]|nr:HDIG domain-containing protein [Armatimonadota bacterium]MDR7519170.1 HDIG domain-containing protein [Armatimonadota bacterium]MDR7550946.1 HDIG domain-containing protein [Armatimonadota bacterium]